MTNILFKTAVVAMLCLSAACESTSPPPSAVLSFTSTAGCAEGLAAERAEVVTVKKRQDSGNITTQVSAASACQVENGVERPFALYRLPRGVDIQSVQAGGVFQVNRVFAADVKTLDENLAPVRDFGPDAFYHRGGSWSVFFRPRDQERYILVRANPELVGKSYLFAQQPPRTAEPETAADGETDEEDVFVPTFGGQTEYSYEGLAFTRIFLSKPATVDPKVQ
jgi:hypothetical protein